MYYMLLTYIVVYVCIQYDILIICWNCTVIVFILIANIIKYLYGLCFRNKHTMKKLFLIDNFNSKVPSFKGTLQLDTAYDTSLMIDTYILCHIYMHL